jgi:hypothetical protein
MLFFRQGAIIFMMSPHFDSEYPPLFSSGFHDIREEDLERIFADPFVAGRRKRSELCKKFREWLKAVKSVGVPLEIWVDGSFATRKPVPNDVDVVCIADLNHLRSLAPEMNMRFHECFKIDAVKSKYGCHAFPMQRGDQKWYDYWIDFFGHSKGGTPKGIVRFFLNGEDL